jgi:hypothetical protein
MTEITASRKNRPRGYIDDYRPQARTLDLLDQVRAVLVEYERYLPLTNRQIFYRLVGRYDFPKAETAYERLCNHINNARRARIIPFEAIRDDSVVTIAQERYNDADDFRRQVRDKAERYRVNALYLQDVHLEVWCEAAGMIHQLDRVASRYSVRVYSSSGFDSTTARKTLAERICDIGKAATILHLGDYDPSGESIYQSLAEDVSAFVDADRPHGAVSVAFKRVALTTAQVARYGLPTAPPKASDSRTKQWVGSTCQLEALAPDQIADLLRLAIEAELDMELHRGVLEMEREDRAELTKLLLTGPGGQP